MVMEKCDGNITKILFCMHFCPGTMTTQSQLIQICSVNWTYVYDTHNIDTEQNQLVIKVSADN